jgi:hypothetical protein
MHIAPTTLARLEAGLIGIGLAAATVSCGGGGGNNMGGMPATAAATQSVPSQMPAPATPDRGSEPTAPPQARPADTNDGMPDSSM